MNTRVRWQALKDNVTLVTTMVLAAPLSAGNWIGFGFSPNGQMVGSTALITTLNFSKGAVVTEYSLNGRSTGQVVKKTGALAFVGGFPEGVFDAASNMVYVSFQVNLTKSAAKTDSLLLAYGSLALDGSINRHTDRRSISAQIATGIFLPSVAYCAVKWAHWMHVDMFGTIYESIHVL